MFWKFDHTILDNIALIDSESNCEITYRELNEVCISLQEEINAIEKQLVFIYADNSIESIISYITLLRSGHAFTIIDKQTNSEFKHKLEELYQPEIIISNSSEPRNGYKESVFNQTIYVYKRKRIANSSQIHKDLALLLSTSGSTGSPKFVRLSYKNIQSNAESITKYLEINSDERAITSLPMSYSYGLSVINSHLHNGAAIVLTNKPFTLIDFWQVFNKYRCTSFAGVPYSYSLLERIKFSKLQLPTLKTLTQAGGRLSEKLQRKYYDLSISKRMKFFVMYGQTEATARISYIPIEKMKNKFGSIGFPIPGGKLKILKDGVDITESGMNGELVYYGNNVMLGYAEDRDSLNKGDELNGALHTGDIGWRDSDGYFYISGRSKRFIKIRGKRFNLDELENFIEESFSIPPLCYGTDDDLRITIKTSDSVLLYKIKMTISKLYNIHPSIIKISLTSSYPVNESGKTDYYKLLNNS